MSNLTTRIKRHLESANQIFDEQTAELARLRAEIERKDEELAALRRLKRSVDEALNSGDGSYRP